MRKSMNNNDPQRRALMNLKQISDKSWQNLDNIQQKLFQTQIQSTQLPLHPKCIARQGHTTSHRANTIQYRSSSPNSSLINPSVFTSLTFYQSQKPSITTFDDRSRLNLQLNTFFVKLKDEKARCTKEKNIHHVNKQVYKQFRNYLMDTFKVDGKGIKKQTHRQNDHRFVTNRRSLYSFTSMIQAKPDSIQKTNQKLINKLQRYKINDEGQFNPRYKSKSYNDSIDSSFLSKTQNFRSRNDNKSMKGRLWVGRPPSTVVSIQV